MIIKYLDAAIDIANEAKEDGRSFSIGVIGNCADILPKLVRDGFKPDVVTDQTSAHDELNGYVPAGYYGDNLKDAFKLNCQERLLSPP